MSLGGGASALGLERFTAFEAIRVAYITEEDSERRIHERIGWLLAGRCLATAPDNFWLWVRRGISIDDPLWQRGIIEEANRLRIQFLGLDPFRGLTSRADQGPAELAPVVGFIRQ